MSPRAPILLNNELPALKKEGDPNGNLEELELARRGFTVLNASTFGAFFIKPKADIDLSCGKKYLVSVKTIGYGYLWEKEIEDTGWADEPDEAEVQREALKPGTVLHFEQSPDIPKDAAWLDVVSEDGEQLCDIPWGATAEEEAAVMKIVNKINDGHKVWAEVSDAEHSTIDAGPDNARIHALEFDVFYQKFAT